MVLTNKARSLYTICQHDITQDSNNMVDDPNNLEKEAIEQEGANLFLKRYFNICMANMRTDPSVNIIPALTNMKDAIKRYQDKRGIRTEQQYNFLSMLHIIGENLYNVLVLMGTMFTNLLPIVDIFVLMLRFIVEKIIEILETDGNDRTLKAVVFLLEIVTMVFVLIFIFGFIVAPVVSMLFIFSNKFWKFLYG